MLTDATLYKNVNDPDIIDPNPKLEQIYNSISKRTILEALLIDKNTPIRLYMDLFGLDGEDILEYRLKYFNLDKNTPRLDLWEYIENIVSKRPLDVRRKQLFTEVFYGGWESIDRTFNRSDCMDIKEYSKSIFKDIMSRIKLEIEDALKNNKEQLKIGNLRSMMGVIKDGVSLFKEDLKTGSATEQLVLDFVNEVQRASKTDLNYIGINSLDVDDSGKADTSLDENVKEEYQSMMSDIKEAEKKLKKSGKEGKDS